MPLDITPAEAPDLIRGLALRLGATVPSYSPGFGAAQTHAALLLIDALTPLLCSDERRLLAELRELLRTPADDHEALAGCWEEMAAICRVAEKDEDARVEEAA